MAAATSTIHNFTALLGGLECFSCKFANKVNGFTWCGDTCTSTCTSRRAVACNQADFVLALGNGNFKKISKGAGWEARLAKGSWGVCTTTATVTMVAIATSSGPATEIAAGCFSLLWWCVDPTAWTAAPGGAPAFARWTPSTGQVSACSRWCTHAIVNGGDRDLSCFLHSVFLLF